MSMSVLSVHGRRGLIHRRSLLKQDLGQAAKIGVGTWFGILFGTVLKLALAFTMLGLFALAWWL